MIVNPYVLVAHHPPIQRAASETIKLDGTGTAQTAARGRSSYPPPFPPRAYRLRRTTNALWHRATSGCIEAIRQNSAEVQQIGPPAIALCNSNQIRRLMDGYVVGTPRLPTPQSAPTDSRSVQPKTEVNEINPADSTHLARGIREA